VGDNRFFWINTRVDNIFLPGSPEGRIIHNTHNRFALFFGLESFFDSCAMGVCIKSNS
jgi:hypothetical protein